VAQQAAWCQIGARLVNAPSHPRDRYREPPQAKLIATIASTHPDEVRDRGDADTLQALRSLARRRRALGEKITDFEMRMLARATDANPGLLAIKASDRRGRGGMRGWANRWPRTRERTKKGGT
jgi:hypothetical protein